VVDVSAATAPSSGQVLTATSGTAATWQTPAGGGGSYTANIRFHYSGAGISNGSTNGGVASETSSGTSSSVLYQALGAVKLTAGTTSTGYARVNLREQVTQDNTSHTGLSFWDRNIYSGMNMSSQIEVASCYQDIYFGIGDVTTVATMTGAIKACGLWVEARNGTLTWYIHTNDGTTSTKTDITTAVNALTNVPDWTAWLANADMWYLEFITGTSFTIYCNGETVATATTNLPSGASSNPSGYIGGIMSDAQTSNTAQKIHAYSGGFIEWPMK